MTFNRNLTVGKGSSPAGIPKFHHGRSSISKAFLISVFNEGWAAHGCTAVPGQPVLAVKQASYRRANSKNQFNI